MKIVKHSILFLFSVALLVATLFVPQEANDKEQMKHLGFGYPLTFATQSFSFKAGSFSYFPNIQKFEPFNKAHAFTILWMRFLESLLVMFVSLEIIIYLMETLDFKIRQKLFKDE
jgi:hypothetical protein